MIIKRRATIGPIMIAFWVPVVMLLGFITLKQLNILPNTPTRTPLPAPNSISGTISYVDPPAVDDNVKALAESGQLNGGDATKGETLYTSLGCAGCHNNGAAGPATAGTYTRVVNERLKVPENAGKTPEEYLAESIIHPGAYVVPNFTDGVMPKDWGTKLDITDVRNLIAYLENQK
jgi:mono/diheme cytochrome c family protein